MNENEQTKTGSGVRHGATGGLTAILLYVLQHNQVPDELAVPIVTVVSGALGAGLRWLMGRFGL